MISLERALKLDLDQKYEKAIQAYQELADEKKGSVELYANQSFLLWYDALEFNFHDEYETDWSPESAKKREYKIILKKGLIEYPNNLELHFWNHYFTHILLGEGMTQSDVDKLLREYPNDSLVPYFFFSSIR